jgi:integrase
LKRKAALLKLPKRRRARGTGTLFERGGVWVARVPVGRYPGGGTRYVEVTADTQAGVIERMKGVQPPGPDTTVAQWCERWLSQQQVRASTLGDRQHTVERWVVPHLGAYRVCELTAGQIERAVSQWTTGPNTSRKNLRTLRTCLEAARRAGLCAANPARDVRGPKAKRREVNPFAPKELAAIIAAATRTTDAVHALLAATGCRLGEALGANVEDYDAATGALTIRRTYDARHGERPPKSDNGRRTIRVPAVARPALQRAIGDRTRGPLFAAENTGGRSRRQHTPVRQAWAVFLRNLGLPYRSPHQLRHSVATALVSAGVPLGDVARYLGDSVQVVVSTYLHATGSDVCAALEAALK